MKILIIDNYDSFTFNLYQTVGEVLMEAGESFFLDVKRNDQVTVAEIIESNYDRIIISPGPGDPSQRSYFGVCEEVLTQLAPRIPILGVCLGLQGMAHYYGGHVVRATQPMHGKISSVENDGQGVFRNLPKHLAMMRYHSLVVEAETVPSCFVVSAVVSDTAGKAEVMGLRHKQYPLEGVQFHPESFATEFGKELLRNFLKGQS